MDIQDIWAWIGLLGGAGGGLFGWWYGRHQAKKKRGLDELYEHIWKTSRATAWIITLVAIYVLFTLLLFGVNLHVAPVLGMLLLIHLGSWAVTGLVLTFKYSKGR